jgi:hypothetical protein
MICPSPFGVCCIPHVRQDMMDKASGVHPSPANRLPTDLLAVLLPAFYT